MNHFIGPDGELYHAWLKKGEESDDHKYIKREWKNGKWAYTYPSDKKKPLQARQTSVSSTSSSSSKGSQSKTTSSSDETARLPIDRRTRAGKVALSVASNTHESSVKTTERNPDPVTEPETKPKETPSTKTNEKKTDWFSEAKNWVSNKLDEAGKNISNKLDEAGKNIAKEVNKQLQKADDFVNSAGDFINKLLYDDPNNMLTINRYNYNSKVNEIMETKEWQDIVDRRDREYVTRKSDGTTEYKIDDYIVDKKHPVLDAIGDLMAGRSISTHEITMESTVAGLKDYGQAAIEIGMLAVGFMTRGLENKFKFSMGSYDDEIEQIVDTVSTGCDYINSVYSEGERIVSEVDPADVRRLVNAMSKVNGNSAASASSSAAELIRNISEDDVVAAITMIMESDAVKEKVGANEYYKAAETVLTNLSDAEIELLNLAIRELRENVSDTGR